MNRISILKVSRDLLLEKGRTITVLVAIILGVFAVAMLSSSRNLLNKNLKENYLRTNPASFTLIVDKFTPEIKDELQKMKEIEDIEIRDMVLSRLVVGESQYIPLPLYIIEDFDQLKLNTFRIDKGAMPDDNNSFVVERTGIKLRDMKIGANYSIYIPGIGEKELKLSGLVHDPGQAPSWMEGVIYGYVKRDFFNSEFTAELKHQVKFTVAKNKYDETHIKSVVLMTRNFLLQKGYNVIRSEVLSPGVHIHERQMNSLMFLIMIFGVLTFVLSCFLIINMISAIMAKEIRQIGIMKAIGAGSGKITGIYLSIVFILGVIATSISTPLGIAAGKAFAAFNAEMLNFELFNKQVDFDVVILIIATGIILPMLIAFIPVWKSSRVSVNQSFNNYGVSPEAVENSKFLSFIKLFPFSKTFIFSVKNSFRRKGRLILTLLTLILAGSLFITTFNIRESTNRSIAKDFDDQPQDLMYQLNKPANIEKVSSLLKTIDGLKEVEYGNTDIVTIPEANGLDGKPIDLKAVDPSSTLYVPEIVDGKWISDSPEGIVVNPRALNDFPVLKLGGEIMLKVNGNSAYFKIVGICRQLFDPPRIYMGNNQYSKLTGHTGYSNLILADITDNNTASIESVNRKIEKVFANNNIEVKLLVSKEEYKHLVVEHLAIIIIMLISMTILVIIVGGLGIVTTMSMNIIERKREIGILRAIGVTNNSLYKIIIYEGGVFGLLSWIFSILLSIPLSIYLGNGFFKIFFESTMAFSLSLTGILIWLIVNIVFCVIASYLPARKAAALSVNQALVYE